MPSHLLQFHQPVCVYVYVYLCVYVCVCVCVYVCSAVAILLLLPNHHSSYEEAGRYLETYKAYENKPPDSLMERVDSDFSSRVSETCFVFEHSCETLSSSVQAVECLTTVKRVCKTDAATLMNTFKVNSFVCCVVCVLVYMCVFVCPFM